MIHEAGRILRAVRRRLLGPRILWRRVIQGYAPPRKRTWTLPSGVPVLMHAECGENPDAAFAPLGAFWDAGIGDLFRPEHRILVKINLNTADPYPASTSPEFLKGFVRFLRERGLHRIYVGDCASLWSLPSRKTAREAGILNALGDTVQWAWLDEHPWMEVPVDGFFLRRVAVPKIALEVDRIVFLANLKTHAQADFTMGLKLAVGLMHPVERRTLHRDHVREKSVEILSAVSPDLVVIDGRRAFITGGPNRGRIETAGAVLAGVYPLETDVEAYGVLRKLKERHGCLEHFEEDPFQMVQLRHARKIGLR